MPVTRVIAVLAALACAGTATAGCGGQTERVDLRPLPTVAAPPYICGHIPLEVVERMTALRAPRYSGSFDLAGGDERASGWCQIFGPADEREPVLQVGFLPFRYYDVDEEIRNGAKRLPEIVPGAEGYYYPDMDLDDGQSRATASLVRGRAQLVVSLRRGGPGRDPAADVVALITQIGPRLFPAENASSPAATAKKKAAWSGHRRHGLLDHGQG